MHKRCCCWLELLIIYNFLINQCIIIFCLLILVINPPYLNCPNDIEATLSTTSNWLTLGPLWQEPQTNINVSALQVYPQNVGSNYKFKFGKNLISYTAVHETGEVLACSFFVEVKGFTDKILTVNILTDNLLTYCNKLNKMIGLNVFFFRQNSSASHQLSI